MCSESEDGVLDKEEAEVGSCDRVCCFLGNTLKDPATRKWWESNRSFFERLSPEELAQRFRDHGATAEATGGCLNISFVNMPPFIVSFSRAVQVYGRLLLG